MAEAVPLWRTRRFWLTVTALLLVGLVFLVIRGEGPKPTTAGVAVEAPK